MPNSPSPETITVSFTLPRSLSEAVNCKARAELTNKSDIIRRALLAYLGEDTKAAVLKEAGVRYEAPNKKTK